MAPNECGALEQNQHYVGARRSCGCNQALKRAAVVTLRQALWLHPA
jgi:hypothetical protein